MYNILSGLILRVSGLLHDIGKINEQFQQKLMVTDIKKMSDYARHDYISFEMFRQLTTHIIKTYKVTEESRVLELLSDVSILEQSMRLVLNKPLFEDTSNTGINIMNETFMKRFPIIYTIYFLVLSHHKLPLSTLNNGTVKVLSHHISESPNAGFINPTLDNDNKKRCTVFNASNKDFLLDTDSYLKHVAKCFSELSKYSVDYDLLHSMMAFYHRTSIIFADRYISSTTPSRNYTPLNEFFANTKKSVDGSKIYSQTLEEHLRDVGASSHMTINSLHDLITGKYKLPAMSSVPDTIKKVGTNKKSKFYWQDNMLKRVQGHYRNGIKDSGFFGVVSSGTGSGKTRANAKLITALSDRPRFTLGVGLRTLTLQTNTEYKKDLGIKSEDLAMLIGSDLSKRLYGYNNDEDMDGEMITDHVTSIRNPFKDMLKDKEKVMVSTPVVVCTTDHLMSISNMVKGKQLASCLRVMSSDIILDEIDSYGETDLVAIGKLIYRSGQAGRKVIISSASVDASIVESFYSAYYKGYEEFCKITGKSMKVFYGLFSEYADINRVHEDNQKNPFNKVYDKFIEKFCDKLNNEIVRRKGTQIDLFGCKDEYDVYEKIMKHIGLFHNNNHTIDPDTGIKVSFGMVRWNTINDCREFARYLYEMPSNEVVKVMCYHSKTFPLYLNEQERILSELCNRKNPLEVMNHSIVKDAINDAKRKGLSDVKFIVSTTSIEEVGRDHDFDYGITEPDSYRSLVQFSGRIRRHRYSKTPHANVGILSKSMKRIKFGSTGEVHDDVAFRLEIVKSLSEEARKIVKPNDVWYKTNANQLNEIFDFKILDNINASPILSKDPGDMILSYHKEKRTLAIQGDESNNSINSMTLDQYINNSFFHHSTFHYRVNPFRFSHENFVFFKDTNHDWYYLFEGSPHERMMANSSVVVENVKNPDRSILDIDEYSMYHRLIADLGISNDPVLCEYLRAVPFAWYNKEDCKKKRIKHQPKIEFSDVLGAKEDGS